MRVAELLGAEVVDAGGRQTGHVHDLRLVQDGPPIGSFGAALRMHSVVFGPTSIGVRLGFERSDVRGPWPLKALFRWLHRHLRAATWNQIASIEEGCIRLRAGEDLARAADEPRAAGRIVDAGLELLDRQVIDRDGRMTGKVDDLALSLPLDGGPPIVTEILSGPGALATRIGGNPGRWLASVHQRLEQGGQGRPAGIPFGVVDRIGSDIRLTVEREGLDPMRFERWVRDTIVERIPGASG